jgi:hypothetical protein
LSGSGTRRATCFERVPAHPKKGIETARVRQHEVQQHDVELFRFHSIEGVRQPFDMSQSEIAAEALSEGPLHGQRVGSMSLDK